jgi:hypothetical protein
VLDLLGGLVENDQQVQPSKSPQSTYVVSLLFPFLGTTTETEHQVKGRLLLDVVVVQGATILKLLACEDQALLVRGNTKMIISKRFMFTACRHTPPYPGFWP